MNNLHDIRYALQSADEETRRSALQELRNSSFPEKDEYFFTAMGDQSWRVRKEAVECYVTSNPDGNSIENLLGLLSNQDNAGLRNSAAEAIIRLGSAFASSLNKTAGNSDADVRKLIIDVMGAIGDPIFVPTLLQALHDPEVNVASAAAEQLGALGDTDASEHLMNMLLSRDEVFFRFSALGALGILSKQMPIPDGLIQLAEQDILKKAVFDCLGTISDDSSLGLLLSSFTCQQKNYRAAALKALYKIYKRSPSPARLKIQDALQLLKEHDTILGLLDLFDSRDVALTEALLWSSTMIRDARFIPLIVEAYADERTTTMSLSTLKSFGHEALHTIIPHYSTLDENGRSGLCFLIGEGEYSGFHAIIQDALHDTSAKVRTAAAISVGKLGLLTLIPDIILLIDDREASVYTAAVASLQALILINRSAVSSEVAQFCSSGKPHYRKAAALLLPSLGEPDRLLLLIKDEDPDVRKAAVMAVGTNNIEASASMLVLALSDEHPEVRVAVADALGKLQDSASLDALEVALNDDDSWVQASVLKAIAAIDMTRARTIMKNIHTSAEGLLMITILKICEEISDSESEAILRYALQSGDRDIARQAAKSLEHVIVTISN